MPRLPFPLRLPPDAPRRLDLSAADAAIGLAIVGTMFIEKLLVDLGGRWIDWPEPAIQTLRSLPAMGLLGSAVFLWGKAFLAEGDGFRQAGLLPRRPVRDLFWTSVGLPMGLVLTALTLAAVAQLATSLGHPPEPVNHTTLRQIQDAETRQELIGMLVLVVGLGPLLEEIAYRGLLQTSLLSVLGQNQRWLVVSVAAALFSVVHVGAVSWHALPGLFVLGVVLGWLYERTGSLWPPFLIHAGFNAFNVWMVLAQPSWAGLEQSASLY